MVPGQILKSERSQTKGSVRFMLLTVILKNGTDSVRYGMVHYGHTIVLGNDLKKMKSQIKVLQTFNSTILGKLFI